MIHVADSAKKRIIEIRTKEGWDESHFIRAEVESGGCSGLTYKLDFDHLPRENDQVFDDNGVRVVTDLKSMLYLFDSTLEFSGGLDGRGFYFNNPNASRECACGESFAV